MKIDRIKVINYWKSMCRKFNAKLQPKSKSRMMRTMGWMLERSGSMTAKKFARYTTTIGRTVYIPFTLGTPSDEWDLEHQIITCAHEMVHVTQAGKTRRSRARFYIRYLTSKKWRTKYEMEAYGANFLFHYRLTGVFLSPSYIAGLLKSYGCSKADKKRAIRYYARINQGLGAGNKIGHPTARYCLDHLED